MNTSSNNTAKAHRLSITAFVLFIIATTAAESQEQTQKPQWQYPDPLVSTTPTNFNAEDRRVHRPVRSLSEYTELANVLREAYNQSPENWPKPHLKDGVTYKRMGKLQPTPYPEDNQRTDEKEELGKLLFFDGRLSGTQQMACASCHVAELGWGDGRARSLGHGANQLERNTPTMLNSAFHEHLFADGRASSLEQLVVMVLTNDQEMRTTPEQVVARIEQIPGYKPLFEKAFGDETITIDRIAKAVATHVRTVVSEPSSNFDRFLNGDSKRLSDSAIRGLHLFRTDAGCINCHSGPLLTDGQFHNIGLVYFGRLYEDRGRYNITGQVEDVGRFRTPSLRNIARSAPYTHTGFLELPGLINFYNAGGARPKPREHVKDDPLWPTTSELLEPLHLNQQDRADLLAFLQSLTERRRRDMLPKLPPNPEDGTETAQATTTTTTTATATATATATDSD